MHTSAAVRTPQTAAGWDKPTTHTDKPTLPILSYPSRRPPPHNTPYTQQKVQSARVVSTQGGCSCAKTPPPRPSPHHPAVPSRRLSRDGRWVRQPKGRRDSQVIVDALRPYSHLCISGDTYMYPQCGGLSLSPSLAPPLCVWNSVPSPMLFLLPPLRSPDFRVPNFARYLTKTGVVPDS